MVTTLYPKGMNVEACNGVCTNVYTHTHTRIYALTVDTYSRWSHWDEKRLEGWERASSWSRGRMRGRQGAQ